MSDQVFILRVYCFLMIGLLLFPVSPINGQGTIVSFPFLDIEGNIRAMDEFADKPVILEWAASWCTICKSNQEAMNQIYRTYRDYVYFVSISYGGSGDNIEKVRKMKEDRGYDWLFGLDHENFAADFGAANGHVWILDSGLSLVKKWESQLVSASQLHDELKELVSVNASEISVEFDTEPPISADFVSFSFLPLLFGILATAIMFGTKEKKKWRRI